MKFKKEYLIIFLIQVTEVLGFSLILPFLPLFALDLNASPAIAGLLITTFSFFQFLTSPILGKLSDHYGRKPLLIFSQFSTFISFLILGFANSLWMLFLSRLVDGILGSNFVIAQAYLSDISTRKERSKVFAISGAAFGVGFLIGPAIGGYLSSLTNLSYKLPGFVAAGVSLLTIFLTIFFLKETVKRKKDIKLSLNIYPFKSIIKYKKKKKVSSKLAQFFLYAMAHATYVGAFAIFVQRKFDLNVQNIGFILMYIGAISVILRAFLIGKSIDRFGEEKLQYFGMSCIITGLLLMSFSNTIFIFMIATTFFAIGAGYTRTLLNGAISKSTSENEQGEVLGVSASLGSISQIFGPLIGGLMLNFFIPGSVTLVAASFMIIGLILKIKEDRNIAIK